MAHEHGKYKVSESVAAAIGRLIAFNNKVLANIRAGNATIEHLELFLDMFLALSFEERDEMLEPFKEAGDAPLKLLSRGKSLKLGELNGLKLIWEAKHVFSYIESAFEITRGKPTAVTPVLVYEVTKEGVDFGRLFGTQPRGIDNACLTQHQILSFVSQYRPWLQSEGGLTCFLFKNEGTPYVACIQEDKKRQLKIFTDHLVNAPFWIPERPPRIVLPKQVS